MYFICGKDVNFVVRGWTVAECVFQNDQSNISYPPGFSKTLCWHKDVEKESISLPLSLVGNL